MKRRFIYAIITLLSIISIVIFFVFRKNIKKEKLSPIKQKQRVIESLDLDTTYNSFGVVLPPIGPSTNPPQCYSQILPQAYQSALNSSPFAIYTANINGNVIIQNLTTDLSYCNGPPIASWTTDKGSVYVCSSFLPSSFSNLNSGIPQYCWNITPGDTGNDMPGCYNITPNTTGTISTCPIGMGCDNTGYAVPIPWSPIFTPWFTGGLFSPLSNNLGTCMPNSSDPSGVNNSLPSQTYVNNLVTNTLGIYSCATQPSPITCSSGLVTIYGGNVIPSMSPTILDGSDIPYVINNMEQCPPGTSNKLSGYSNETWEGMSLCLPGSPTS